LVGPSDVPSPVPQDELPEILRDLLRKKPEMPRPLAGDEVQALKVSVVEAAARAQKAGFDGVELHGAHGYLLGQFTSPYFNRRKDDYGGSPNKRWNLSREIIREIKKAMGPDFVVGYRFSAREFIPGAMDLTEAIPMARAIQEAGADYLSVSHGCYGSLIRMFPRGQGSMSEDAATIQKNVTIPVMAPNFQDPEKAAEAIASGSISQVALSRALLADPLWPRKVREGRPEDIQPCIRCYRCVRAAILEYSPVRCPVNPLLGFERFAPQFFPRPL
jgi:2,4-dienoyl-CoA reductase-like NADH-dependent reductase (Old Yellow Enzyme family)